MKIGFLTPKLTFRGTEVAVYDYADYCETLLKHDSIIITRPFEVVEKEMDVEKTAYDYFQSRFNIVYYECIDDLDLIVEKNKLNVLYIIKGGRMNENSTFTTSCKCVIHAVFDSDDPHGDVYAVVGKSVNKINNTSHPVVPHMIRLDDTTDDLRDSLNIPKDALVFGRYGGLDSFDIYGVLKYIHSCSINNVFFLFMNTNWFSDNPRIKYIQGTTCKYKKRQFINTCDAMIHARTRGETFGLACGEFALAGKHILTCRLSKETNHIDILGRKAMLYENEMELDFLIRNFKTLSNYIDMKHRNPYEYYRPENVMKIFDSIFLKKT